MSTTPVAGQPVRGVRDPVYRWWPRYRPGSVELGGAGWKMLVRTMVMFFVVGAFLALPPVAEATGLSSLAAIVLMGSYLSCMVVNDYVLHPLAMKGRAGFNLQMAVTPLYNVFFCAAFVVAAGDPKTPLWIGLVLYACATAMWQELEASIALLCLHVVGPLVTIPFFLGQADAGAAGHSDVSANWAIAAPVLCAAFSGLSYHGFALISATWRQVRADQARTIEALRQRASDLERRQLARDLHDSVGSVLALVGLYGDLVERHVHSADDLRRISATLRDAGREGLGELRGVLDAMAPADATLGVMAESLRRLAARVTEASAAEVQVQLDASPALEVASAGRLAIVRVFQEALNNAIRHGQARHVDARLGARPGVAGNHWVVLEVNDDGVGFDATRPSEGRGLGSMRARASELGGTLELVSAPGGGTRLRLELAADP